MAAEGRISRNLVSGQFIMSWNRHGEKNDCLKQLGKQSH